MLLPKTRSSSLSSTFRFDEAWRWRTVTHPRAGGPVEAGSTPEHRITVLGSNVAFAVRRGETVFEAAARNGFIWPTVCGGRADCTRCSMVVLEGAENLSPMTELEREALDRARWAEGEANPDERLACCTELTGSVVVHRRSVRLRD